MATSRSPGSGAAAAAAAARRGARVRAELICVSLSSPLLPLSYFYRSLSPRLARAASSDPSPSLSRLAFFFSFLSFFSPPFCLVFFSLSLQRETGCVADRRGVWAPLAETRVGPARSEVNGSWQAPAGSARNATCGPHAQ